MRTLHGAAVALCAIALLAGEAARAEALPLWELGAGLSGLRLPHYRGSDQAQGWILPFPYFIYRGRILRADRDGARAVLLEDDRLDVDLSANASAPVDSADSRARQGMDSLPGTLELGPKLNLHLVRERDWTLDVRLPLRAVVSLERSPRALGWTFTPVLNLDWHAVGHEWGVQGGPMWGNRKLHDHLYGVDADEATATRPAYAAPGGFAGWQATFAVSRRTSDLWYGAYLRLDSVQAAAFEPSPLVRSTRQVSGGFAVAWILRRSDAPAPAGP
jgi:outer membrane scaffolding protein for murein synthesis (MipA/OmpV family)